MTLLKQVMQKHGIKMQFAKVFLGPCGWGVTVYKLYAVYTGMGFMYDLL